jgi:hypothetical protein
METTDFIKVYEAAKLYEAELVVGLLSFNGIEAATINKQDGRYLFGEIEVYVTAKDAEKAKEIIAKRDE